MATPSPTEVRATTIPSGHWIQTVMTLLQDAIKWTALVVITYVVTDSMKALAGKTTVTNVSVNVGTDLLGGLTWAGVLKHGLPIVTIMVLMGWGWQERRLRRQTLIRLQNRIRSLERILDPDRSSATPFAQSDKEET